MNPARTASEHAIALDEGDHTPDVEVVRHTGGYYRIKPPRAEAIIREVQEAVGQWRRVAAKLGVHRGEIESMAAAFAVDG
jgi:serine/threonine-protein kinase HipA